MDKKLVKKAEKLRDELLASAQTLGITILSPSKEGEELPDIGFAPFIRHAGCFYIYSSDLSSHIRSLIAGQPAQFFLIADEGRSPNIWARVRMKFTADVIEIDRDAAEFQTILDDIGNAHGPVMDLIREFTDFHLFKMTPINGSLVTGFAAAFTIEGADFTITEHLRQG
jgi:putative heme iron utilization protein